MSLTPTPIAPACCPHFPRQIDLIMAMGNLWKLLIRDPQIMDSFREYVAKREPWIDTEIDVDATRRAGHEILRQHLSEPAMEFLAAVWARQRHHDALSELGLCHGDGSGGACGCGAELSTKLARAS